MIIQSQGIAIDVCIYDLSNGQKKDCPIKDKQSVIEKKKKNKKKSIRE